MEANPKTEPLILCNHLPIAMAVCMHNLGGFPPQLLVIDDAHVYLCFLGHCSCSVFLGGWLDGSNLEEKFHPLLMQIMKAASPLTGQHLAKYHVLMSQNKHEHMIIHAYHW